MKPREGFIRSKLGKNLSAELDTRRPKSGRLRRGMAGTPIVVPAHGKLDMKPLLGMSGEECCLIAERSPDLSALLRRGFVEVW